ncbi:hypothetical protein DOY81_007582, partial [Sarcophaga bullata]
MHPNTQFRWQTQYCRRTDISFNKDDVPHSSKRVLSAATFKGDRPPTAAERLVNPSAGDPEAHSEDAKLST